jgi:hypothetical protein
MSVTLDSGYRYLRLKQTGGDVSENKARPAWLGLDVMKYGGLQTSVSAADGLWSRLFIEGIAIHGDEDVDKSQFHGKLVWIELYSPPASEQLANFAREEGVPSVCGSVKLLKGIEPRPYRSADRDDPELERPIQVYAQVDYEIFLAIVAQLADAERRKLVIRIDVRFGGTALPPDNSFNRGLPFVPLSRLDVAADRTYALISISLSTTIVKDLGAGRVRGPIDRHRTKQHYVVGKLIDAQGQFDLESGTVSEIQATFTIRNSKLPLENSEISVVWREYKRDAISGDYPGRADAGRFAYSPASNRKSATDSYALGCYLYLELSYTQEDAWSILVPMLLKRPQNSDVELVVYLLVDEATLLATPDLMRGRVGECHLKLHRGVS